MNYLFDWNRIKNEIDIEQYFLFKMGNLYYFDRYKKAYVFKMGEKSGDIIRFFRHEKSDVKIYYSMVYNDSGDLIQFIKKRVLQNENAGPEEINAALQEYLGTGGTINTANNRSYLVSNDSQSEKYYEVYGDIIQKIEQHYKYLFEYRKLSADTVHSELFKDIFFTYKTSTSSESLSFYLKDIDGKIVGINRIQTSENEFFNKKWFDKNSRNGIGFTFTDKLCDTETLSIFESIFDAMSFHEINKLSAVQYCITNGELSFRKAKLIQEYFNKNNFKNIILGNDNDLAGNYFNLNIIGSFIQSVIGIRKSVNTICIEIENEADTNKINVLAQFFKKSEFKFDLEDHKDFPQSYCKEIVEGKEHYFFMISNTKEAIQFFIDLLLITWKLDDFVIIQQPINKDFNEDLIQLKNTTHA